jgi:pimeloyl-ACP methyl ester carboxylesterase
MTSEWAEGDVATAAGVRLHYYRRGSGPSLVLAHGVTDNGMCWRRVADALADGFDVVAYDAPSHGRSDDGPPGSGADVVAVVEALGLSPALAMGHSMGAGAVSEAIGVRPDLFRAAVLEDPGWMTEERRAEIQQLIRQATEAGATGAGRGPTMADGRPTHPVDLADWEESKTQFRPPENWGLARLTAMPWQANVKKFACPVLLVWGTSGLVTEDTTREARRLYPDLQDVRLDAGHDIRREAYDDFLRVVRSFLEAAPAAPPVSAHPGNSDRRRG